MRSRSRKSSDFRPYLQFVLLLIFGMIIGALVFYINARSSDKDSEMVSLGVGASVVISGSMEPELSVGDFIIYRKKGDYAVGDVVVYQTGTMPVVHRIVSVNEDHVITQGDANNTTDMPVPMDSIKGAVTVAVPYVGYAIMVLKTPAGILGTIMIAIVLLMLSCMEDRQVSTEEQEELRREIRQLKKELKENEKKH